MRQHGDNGRPPLEEYVYRRLAEEIRSWDRELVGDVYALSFLIEYDEDDIENEDEPLRPQLLLSYNTIEQWQKQSKAVGEEARWNFAFWLQDFQAAIGNREAFYGHSVIGKEILADLEGVRLREEWIASLGVIATEEEDVLGEPFIHLCQDVVRRLHHEGVIEGTFGKPIPILIHDLEYDNATASQSRDANPPGLTQEFEAWVSSMYEGE